MKFGLLHDFTTCVKYSKLGVVLGCITHDSREGRIFTTFTLKFSHSLNSSSVSSLYRSDPGVIKLFIKTSFRTPGPRHNLRPSFRHLLYLFIRL